MNSLAVLVGAFLWAVATLAVYFGGARLFLTGGVGLVVLFAATVPAAWAILAGFWRLARTPRTDRLGVAALIVTPALLLDTMLFLGRTAVLPGFTPGAADRFAAWVMWAAAATLVIAIRGSRPRP